MVSSPIFYILLVIVLVLLIVAIVLLVLNNKRKKKKAAEEAAAAAAAAEGDAAAFGSRVVYRSIRVCLGSGNAAFHRVLGAGDFNGSLIMGNNSCLVVLIAKAVQLLVASGVPGLEPENVAVIDSATGKEINTAEEEKTGMDSEW